MSKGTKHDNGKAPISLIPRAALVGTAQALDFGAKKYNRYNFMEGIEYTRLTDASMRHILAFLDGEDLDPESGLNHIKHAAANLCMLLYMIDNRQEMDDRYKSTIVKQSESVEEIFEQAINEMKRGGFSYGKQNAYHIQVTDRASKFEDSDSGDKS
jgi:hypothetical protein